MPLKGSCNRCGACCFVGPYRCTNLLGKTGEKTTCAVYDKRYTNMPIWLVAPSGAAIQGYCMHNSLDEELRLMDLVEQGKCSYEIEYPKGGGKWLTSPIPRPEE